MPLSDSLTANLREVARELLDARSDAEKAEAVRAFLTACRNYRIAVDDLGELTRETAKR